MSNLSKLFICCFSLLLFIPASYAVSSKNNQTEALKFVKSKQKANLVKPKSVLNLNQATAKQISKHFKGIGPKRAKAIVDYRDQHGVFKSFEDLAKVRGISKRFVKKNLKRLNASFKLDETA